MENKQKELLERVLLLMKYDNKQTLSENYYNIREQQIGYDSYLDREANKEDTTDRGPRTPFKDITCSNGTYRVPESAEPLMGPNSGLIKGLNWSTDETGYYNTVSQFRRHFGKPKMFSSVSGVTEETKVYYPTSGYLGSVMKFNLPIGFKIPKGTKIPVEQVTGFFDADLDEILLIDNPQDIICTTFTGLPAENFDIAIHPEKYNDESRGWQMKPHVYYENPNKQGEWIPYDPKNFIDERTEEDARWDKYGIFVEILGQALIDIGCTFTGPGAFACMAILGAAFNLPIAMSYMKRGKSHEAAVSFVFAAMPFLHGAYGKAAEKLVAKMGLETFDKACTSISSKVLQQAPKTGDDWAAFYKTLSYSEKEAMVIVSKMEPSVLKTAMEIATKKAVSEMASKGISVNSVRGIFGSLIKGDLKSLITKFPYIKSGKNLTRFISYTALDMTAMKGLGAALESVKGEKLTPLQEYGVLLFITSFPEDEQINVANSIIEQVKNNDTETAKEVISSADKFIENACNNLPKETSEGWFSKDIMQACASSINTNNEKTIVPDTLNRPIEPKIQNK
jgi:hypothetical protein